MHSWLSEHSFTALEAQGDQALPRTTLPLAPPRQVGLSAGDAVVCHYLLPHNVAPHCGAELRPMLYFRVSARPWREWPDARGALLADAYAGMPSLSALRRSLGWVAEPQPSDVLAAALRAQADAAWDAKFWMEACESYSELAALRPRETQAAMRAGCAGTWAAKALRGSGDVAGAAACAAAGGGPLAAAAARLRPLAWLQAVMVRNLALQGRAAEALHAFRASLMDAQVAQPDPGQSWHRDLLADALHAATEVAPGEAAALRAAFSARFPDVLGDEDVAAMGVAELWAAGNGHLHKAVKNAADWRRCRLIFPRLAAMQPASMWAHASASIAFCFAPGASVEDGARALAFAAAAAAADPASPVPPALRAKALSVSGGGGAEVLSAVEALLAHGASAEEQKAHGWLLRDVAKCAKRACGEDAARATELAEVFAALFPAARE